MVFDKLRRLWLWGAATDALMIFDFLIRQVYTKKKEDTTAEFLEQRGAEMAEKRKVVLSDQQYAELVKTRDHHAVPYMRQRAAAIIKVSEGASMTHVGKYGLLRKVRHETISEWIDRYEREGINGLYVREGRGRKPAFFPCARIYRDSSTRSAKHGTSFTSSLRYQS